MSSPNDDRDNWLAMQYVLGELSETEQQAFEDRLAGDLAACEAVTRASRLLLTAREALVQSQPAPALVAPAVPVLVAPATPIKPQHNSWLVVIVSSAAVALLCLLGLQTPTKTADVARLTGRDPAAAELVSLWHSGMSVADSESDDLDELADAAGDVAVPGWMLAAVSFEADGPDNFQEN